MRVTQHEHALAAVVARCAASCHAGARAQASIIRGESSLIQSRRPLIQTSVRSSVSRLMDGSAGWQQEHALGAGWASCAASARRGSASQPRAPIIISSHVYRDSPSSRFGRQSVMGARAGGQRDAAMRVTQHEHALAAVVARCAASARRPRLSEPSRLASSRARARANVRERARTGARGARRGAGTREPPKLRTAEVEHPPPAHFASVHRRHPSNFAYQTSRLKVSPS